MKYLKFCPEYQAVYDAYAKKPHLFEAMAFNRWIITMKKDGTWDTLEALYPQLDVTYYKNTKTGEITREMHSSKDSLINWINP